MLELRFQVKIEVDGITFQDFSIDLASIQDITTYEDALIYLRGYTDQGTLLCTGLYATAQQRQAKTVIVTIVDSVGTVYRMDHSDDKRLNASLSVDWEHALPRIDWG